MVASGDRARNHVSQLSEVTMSRFYDACVLVASILGLLVLMIGA